MLSYIASGLGSAILAFARYRISALGVRKFVAEVAGVYAVDELVSVAAEYSDWVKQNETNITLGLTLSLMARNSLLSMIGRGGKLASIKVLFSNTNMAHSLSSIKAWIRTLTVKATNSGVEIVRDGKLILKLASDGKTISFKHNGTAAAAALLAAGLGGTVPTCREEWQMTGEQLAAQLSDMEYSLTEQQLRSRLYEFSPGTLFSSGSSLVQSFLREHPNYSEEKAFAILMEVLNTEDIVAGYHSLDGFKDNDGVSIYRIDGSYYKREDQDNTYVLSPAIPSEGVRTPLDEEGVKTLVVLEAALGKVRTDGGLTLLRVAETDRFISTPFTVGDTVASLLIDVNNPVPHFVFAEDTFFDSKDDNLEDDLDETSLEAVKSWISTFPDFFGDLSRDDKVAEQQTDFDRKVHMILPILGASYRNGMLYLDAEDLRDGLGK